MNPRLSKRPRSTSSVYVLAANGRLANGRLDGLSVFLLNVIVVMAIVFVLCAAGGEW